VSAVVWGAGAIGSLAAAFGARAGENVSLVDVDAEHVQAVNRDGLRVVGLEEFEVDVPAACPEQVEGPLDLVVLAVKSQHTTAALDRIEPLLSPTAVIVSLQNGMNPPVIAQRLGEDRTIGVLIGWAGDILQPGVVRFGTRGHSYLGSLRPDGPAAARLAEVQRLLDHVVPATPTDNILGYLWSKQCDCSLLVASALTDETIGDVLCNDLGRRVIQALLVESVAAADSLGVRLEPCELFDPRAFRASAAPSAGYAFLDALAAESREGQKPHSGMWRDIVVRKRRSETDYLTGALVREAQAHGLAVPLNARLVQQIAEIEAGARTRGWHNFQELADLLPA
jgi:2-dehydropantoate 2-reductase